MHRPPAVSHHVSRSRWQGFLLLGIWSAGLGLTAYFYIFQQSPLLSVILLTIWLTSGWGALRAWLASPVGLLQWDGECWHWMQEDEARTCSVCMVWNLQRRVLLRLTFSEASAQWLWLEAGKSDHQWTALRRALVSSDAEFTAPLPVADLEDQR